MTKKILTTVAVVVIGLGILQLALDSLESISNKVNKNNNEITIAEDELGKKDTLMNILMEEVEGIYCMMLENRSKTSTDISADIDKHVAKMQEMDNNFPVANLDFTYPSFGFDNIRLMDILSNPKDFDYDDLKTFLNYTDVKEHIESLTTGTFDGKDVIGYISMVSMEDNEDLPVQDVVIDIITNKDVRNQLDSNYMLSLPFSPMESNAQNMLNSKGFRSDSLKFRVRYIEF